MKEQRYSSTRSYPRPQTDMSGKLHSHATLLPWKMSPEHMGRRMGGPRRRSGHFGKEEISFLCPESNRDSSDIQPSHFVDKVSPSLLPTSACAICYNMLLQCVTIFCTSSVLVNGPDYFSPIHDRNFLLKKFPQITARKVDFPSECQALLHVLGVKHILAKVGFRAIKIPS